MKKNLYVILPIPRPEVVAQWDRVLPMDLFPGGIRDLVTAALEHESNFDSFFDDVFTMMEVYSHDERNHAARRVQRLMTSHNYLEVLQMLLEAFHNDTRERVRHILGSDPLHFARVVSYRSSAGICVELSREPLPQVHYCPAR